MELKNIKSVHAEEAVVSMMMQDKYSQNEATSLLQAADFTDSKLSLIFETIDDLMHKGISIDVITVVEALKKNNKIEYAGGFDFIADLAKSIATAKNISSYVRVVLEKSLSRRMIIATQKAAELVKNGDGSIHDRLHYAEQEILAVSRNISQTGFEKAAEFIEKTQKNFLEKANSEQKYTGLETGFTAFDNITAGLQNSDYIIVAARPSMGKTAFALNLFTQIAEKNKKPVALFSLEMPTEQLVNRLLATQSQITLDKIKSPSKMSKGEKDRLYLAADEISQLPLYINDQPSLTIGKLVASARKLHADLDQELSCIIVDYITLISSTKNHTSYVHEVAEISAQLKTLARELKIPVVVLSQLSRKVEGREDKRPMMSDLRDSGAIEQDADLVMFLYRDGYYNREKADNGETEMIIGKHRNGPTTNFKLFFDKTTGKFNG